MVTTRESVNYNGNFCDDMVCLSTDTKPTEKIMNGATILEMDTGKVFVFSEASAQWIEL